MYFYIDESGNSGNNLFDRSQPVLSYGVLSSEVNVDEQALEPFAGDPRQGFHAGAACQQARVRGSPADFG